jgi:hypothetical protein
MLLSSPELSDGSCFVFHQHAVENPSEYLPLRDHRIHMRNALNVNASGTTKRRSTSADVDSNSSSTMPTAYRTIKMSQLRFQRG